MTAREETLIVVGSELVRVLGHKMGCPKIAPSIPCSCGAGREQSQAINNWVHLIQQIKGA
jgi:hypothetical protein